MLTIQRLLTAMKEKRLWGQRPPCSVTSPQGRTEPRPPLGPRRAVTVATVNGAEETAVIEPLFVSPVKAPQTRTSLGVSRLTDLHRRVNSTGCQRGRLFV